MCERQKVRPKKPVAVDLFSGCGGLTLGLKRAGFRVSVAVENDSLACRTYRSNHRSTALIERDIQNVRGADIVEAAGSHVDLVAGCPPCQGFSTMRTKNGRIRVEDAGNELVFEFLRIVTELQPSMVMLENVPALATDERITQVVSQFEEQGLRCTLAVLNARHFGVPQRRRRMILLASNQSCPALAGPSDRTRTVRGVIGRLPKPCESQDSLHNYSVRRSPSVMAMIKRTPKDGGSRKDLPAKYMLACHRRFDGFKDVYGRMSWSRPAPTITGGCINPSKGRFLHPEQDRAITLREAAMLQGFPRRYRFDMSRGRYPAAQMIGNAFPPIFAQKHAAALLQQQKEHVRAD